MNYKRFTAHALLIVFITLMFAFPVSAEEIAGWTVEYQEPGVYDAGATPIDRSENFAEVSNEIYYAGDHSLLCAYPKTKQDNTGMKVINPLTKTLEHGQYNFSFYAKGTFSADGVYAGISDDTAKADGSLVRLNYTSRYTATDAGNGWKFYQFSVKYDTSGSYFLFYFQYTCAGLYIDNVVLTKAGDSENLIVNGDFETGANTQPKIGTTKYDPKNVIISQQEYSIHISWRNPKTTDITSVALYDITNGTETLLSGEFSLVSDAINKFLISNLVTDKDYVFRLVFNFAGHESTEYTCTAATIPKNTFNVPTWSAVKEASSLGYTPVRANLDKTEIYSGSTSLHVASNLGVAPGNGKLLLSQKTQVDSAKKYKLSFWARMNNANGISVMLNGEAFDNGSTVAQSDSYVTTKWKKFEYTFSNRSSGNLEFQIEKNTEDFWLDDVELYELAEEIPVGENLIANGGFEDGITTIPNPPQNVTAQVSQNIASIAWSLPAGQYETVNVYRINGMVYSLCGSFASKRSIDFNRIKIEQAYDFVLMTQDSYGNMSEAIPVSLQWVANAYTASDFLFYNANGEQITTLQPGNITVKTSVKNNHMGDSFNAILVAAVFCDGEMIRIVPTDRKSIPQTAAGGMQVDFNVNILVPEGDYQLELFLWSGLSDMVVLKSCTILK